MKELVAFEFLYEYHIEMRFIHKGITIKNTYGTFELEMG